MYILECFGGGFYTGSTKDLQRRLAQHQAGEGANYTKKHLPVKLVYYEEYPRIDTAFYREKQIQGWSHKKKEALIKGDIDTLKQLSVCRNSTRSRSRSRLRSTSEHTTSEHTISEHTISEHIASEYLTSKRSNSEHTTD